MQSEEVGFQFAFERGQRLGCSDVHRKVIPPSWGQNRAVANEQCRCDGGGGGARRPEVAERRGLAGV